MFFAFCKSPPCGRWNAEISSEHSEKTLWAWPAPSGGEAAKSYATPQSVNYHALVHGSGFIVLCQSQALLRQISIRVIRRE